MPSSNSVEACPRACPHLVLLLRSRANCCSACALMRAERLKTLLNGCKKVLALLPKSIQIGSWRYSSGW